MAQIKHNMKKLPIIILTAIALVNIMMLMSGCQKQISELDRIVEENNYTIVDVRTKEEYETGHVKDSINIPVDEIQSRLNELDKNKTIIVYCRSGKRSTTAYNILIENGYKSYNLGAYESITKFEKGA